MKNAYFAATLQHTDEASQCPYRHTGWIGTVEVNRDAGLEPGMTFCLCVSPGSGPVSRYT